MLSRYLFVLPLLALAADDQWTKVREVKSGTELRIYKKGYKAPIAAKMDEATEDKLMIVIGESQVAIPKEEIDRIEQRPLPKGSRVTPKTTKGVFDSDADSPGQPMKGSQPMKLGQTKPPASATSSSSSNVAIGGKPPFEPLYRRPLTSPKPE